VWAIVGSGSKGEQIQLQAAGATGSNPFTVSVVSGPITPPSTTTTTGPAQNAKLVAVQGGTPGLYGGTMNIASCDPQKMIDYLVSQPAKAAAWASAIGISPSKIPSYVRDLTPVVLTRDTRVTNHGFVNGSATPFQAVLQAGTAVLVDRYGVPRAKCACGNPLGPPTLSTAAPSYQGPSWPSFSPTNITVVVVNTTVVNNFVLVSQDNGNPFVRPRGSDGVDDQTLSQAAICQLLPQDPSCTQGQSGVPTTTTTTAPAGQVHTVFSIASIQGVFNDPTAPSVFTLTQTTHISSITDYHWNDGQGATPGTIGLRSADGKLYGPWPATGSNGQGGVPNAYWTATPDVSIPAGTYTVVDSDPASWAWAQDTSGQGMVTITGY
jgi:hypothetical protein